MQPPSITESPNELTSDIDVASPRGIVRLLHAADAQICGGYRGYPAICDDEVTAKIVRVIRWAAPLMGREDAAIIISGAGTSGRLAMFAARTFNRFLTRRKRRPNFRYLIAGGDLALIKAQEGAEDDPRQAWEDVRPLIKGKRRVLYVGITCALAAPYVASQLLGLLRRPGARCVLMGFNPKHCARNVEVENWDRTFADVVGVVSARPSCVVLNPVVGPEAITGSTRMKGGSATKLLLETIFALAASEAHIAGGSGKCPSLPAAVRECIRAYDAARVAAYEQSAEIASLIELGGRGLRRGGHIYYVGSGSPGILGIVDASECPPTFGAGFEDVRGFVVGGWRTLLGPGHDLSAEGPWYRISLHDFLAEKVPQLTRRDLVVALPSVGGDARLGDALRRSRKAGAAVAAVETQARVPGGISPDLRVRTAHLPRSMLPGAQVFREYATKLVLNALTTGAHVLSGKVYRNRLADLRISNNKLYHRAIWIIRDIMGVSAATAKRCLLRSIHGVDRVSPALMRAKPSRHVEAATDAAKVVPRALIMAGSRATHADAEKILRKEPVVRAAIERLKKASKQV